MNKIINVRDFKDGIESAARYFNSAWPGIHTAFYLDAMRHSDGKHSPLPQFYLLMENERITGCYGLAVNDFISRHDLYPWFVALYIEKEKRGQALGSLLLEHAAGQAAAAGFDTLYLTTDHDGYYEKYGWKRIGDGYERDGASARIYARATAAVTGPDRPSL